MHGRFQTMRTGKHAGRKGPMRISRAEQSDWRHEVSRFSAACRDSDGRRLNHLANHRTHCDLRGFVPHPAPHSPNVESAIESSRRVVELTNFEGSNLARSGMALHLPQRFVLAPCMEMFEQASSRNPTCLIFRKRDTNV